VPLSIFQDVGGGGEPPPPPKPSTQIESFSERNELEIKWPNVLRIDTVVTPVLAMDWKKVDPLTLDPATTIISADVAPAVGGATDMSKVHSIDLEKLPDDFRLQRLTFKAARKAFNELHGRFTGNPEFLVVQLVRIIEQFLESKLLSIPSLYHQEPLRKRILIALNIDVVIQHLLRFISEQNTARMEPVFDEEFPIGSTRFMRTWYSTKPCHPTRRSQISHMVADSSWEQFTANLFEGSDLVRAYAKNDHLGFQVYYLWNGARRRFVPDFLVRLADGRTLVLEIKGEDSEQNRAKRAALDVWVKAVNAKGGFGKWCWDVAFMPAQIQDILQRHAALATA
jgi:type III restriction enzyme